LTLDQQTKTNQLISSSWRTGHSHRAKVQLDKKTEKNTKQSNIFS